MIEQEAARHDPGGKSKWPLQPGVVGDAEFSACGRYRLWLSRGWAGSAESSGYALWIGMNPSVADPIMDDPTIRKEMYFTRLMEMDGYVKCNAMDYRSTSPKALLSVRPRSDQNLRCIVDHARQAERIILAWGALPKPLRRYADDVVMALRGIPLFCMGKTKDNSPRHPLYLPHSAECVPWP